MAAISGAGLGIAGIGDANAYPSGHTARPRSWAYHPSRAALYHPSRIIIARSSERPWPGSSSDKSPLTSVDGFGRMDCLVTFLARGTEPRIMPAARGNHILTS